MKTAIEVRDLHKAYGKMNVLNGLDMQVQYGEIFGLLGANGAGKTTALECIEGLLPYECGQIRLTGSVGVQLQNGALPESILAREAVSLFCVWHGCAPPYTALDRLGVPALYAIRYRNLSVGQKRKLHLALAMCGDPDILILDEPTAGLDIEGRLALENLLHDYCADGMKAVLLSSHDMGEVDRLCDRVLILKDGKEAWSGRPGRLATNDLGEHHIIVHTASGVEEFWAGNIAAALVPKLLQWEETGTEILDISTQRTSLLEKYLEVEQR